VRLGRGKRFFSQIVAKSSGLHAKASDVVLAKARPLGDPEIVTDDDRFRRRRQAIEKQCSLRVAIIVFLRLDIRADIFGRRQSDVMAVSGARPR